MRCLFPVLPLVLSLAATGACARPAEQDEVDALRQEVAALRAAVRELQSALQAAAPVARSVPPAGAGAAPAAQAPAAATTTVTTATTASAGTASPAATTPAAGTLAAEAASPSRGGEARLFGYGELNYNRVLRDTSASRADLRRFVVGVSYAFSDRLRLESEIEWEHAVTSATDQGESEIEQAWLNYALKPGLDVKAGLFLMPFGLLNTAHEPPAFYGVERNEVETRIIPSTWREGGLALVGNTQAGWNWEGGITTGFDIAHFDQTGAPLAGVHQEMQLAHTANLSAYGALNWRGTPGFTAGGALFSGNAGQANADWREGAAGPNLGGLSARVTLGELHVRWQPARWDLQALVARGQIGEAAAIDARIAQYNGGSGLSLPMVPSAFQGWYAQAAYRAWGDGDMSLWPFARVEYYNTQAGLPAGVTPDPAAASHVLTTGLTWRLHPQVVIKADYQRYNEDRTRDRVDLGLGYMF